MQLSHSRCQYIEISHSRSRFANKFLKVLYVSKLMLMLCVCVCVCGGLVSQGPGLILHFYQMLGTSRSKIVRYLPGWCIAVDQLETCVDT